MPHVPVSSIMAGCFANYPTARLRIQPRRKSSVGSAFHPIFVVPKGGDDRLKAAAAAITVIVSAFGPGADGLLLWVGRFIAAT